MTFPAGWQQVEKTRDPLRQQVEKKPSQRPMQRIWTTLQNDGPDRLGLRGTAGAGVLRVLWIDDLDALMGTDGDGGGEGGPEHGGKNPTGRRLHQVWHLS